MSGSFYKIVAAENKGEKDNPHGGKLIKWTVTLLNSRGDQLTNVYWQRKPDSDVTVGDVIQGKVERGDYGPRFKWEKVPDDAVNPFPKPDGAPDRVTPPVSGPQASKPSLSAGVPPPGPTQAAAAPGTLTKDEEIRWAVCLKAAAEVVSGGLSAGKESNAAELLAYARVLFKASPTDANTGQDNGAGEEKTPAPASSLNAAVDSEVAGGGLVEEHDEAF